MLTSGFAIALRMEYSVVVLPLPVGPVTSRMPFGLRMACRSQRYSRGAMPISSSGIRPPFLSSSRSTADSPWIVGKVETRTSNGTALQFGLEPAVLRQALLGDVQVGEDLHARDGGAVHGHRLARQFAQDAVDPHAHAQRRLVGLEVDVAGAARAGRPRAPPARRR